MPIQIHRLNEINFNKPLMIRGFLEQMEVGSDSCAHDSIRRSSRNWWVHLEQYWFFETWIPLIYSIHFFMSVDDKGVGKIEDFWLNGEHECDGDNKGVCIDTESSCGDG